MTRKEKRAEHRRSAPDLNTLNLANLLLYHPEKSLTLIHIKFPALPLTARRRKFYKDSIVCFIENHN